MSALRPKSTLVWLAVASAITSSCTSSSSPSASGGTGASGGASHGGDGGVHDAGIIPPKDSGTDAPDASSWQPGIDSPWTNVAWESQCGVEVADQPKLAVPPLVWGDCPDKEPGCSSIVVNWGTSAKTPTSTPSVIRWGSGYRVGFYLVWSASENRAAVYDVDGTPLVVWRVPDQCVPITPRLGPSRVWFGAQAVEVGKSAYIVEPYDALYASAKALPVTVMAQGQASSDDTLSLWGLDGKTITLFDRTTNTSDVFGPSPGFGYMLAQPIGDFALVQHFPTLDQPQGFIWSRATHALTPLLDPPQEAIPDVKTDGSTIVWIQTPPHVQGQPVFPQGDLWTSPFATTKAGLIPSKRRPAALVGTSVSAAGEGFYALFSNADMQVHVYRLSDARHWAFKPPAKASNFWQVVHVDSDKIWYQTKLGVYRQTLQDLGPGDPAP